MPTILNNRLMRNLNMRFSIKDALDGSKIQPDKFNYI